MPIIYLKKVKIKMKHSAQRVGEQQSIQWGPWNSPLPTSPKPFRLAFDVRQKWKMTPSKQGSNFFTRSWIFSSKFLPFPLNFLSKNPNFLSENLNFCVPSPNIPKSGELSSSNWKLAFSSVPVNPFNHAPIQPETHKFLSPPLHPLRHLCPLLLPHRPIRVPIVCP